MDELDDRRETGIRIQRELLAAVYGDDPPALKDGRFAEELRQLSIDNVFGAIWGREGLDRRSRSLVTISILIALRATGELRLHLQIGLANGLTREELEEVVYHSSAYAGFPAASAARAVAIEVLGDA
jgi:4-carboxymuconolactone decarboxylase